MPRSILLLVVVSILLTVSSCKQKKMIGAAPAPAIAEEPAFSRKKVEKIELSQVEAFYNSYPELAKYRKDAEQIYRNYDFHPIWLDEKGIAEFGHSLYSKTRELNKEGIASVFPGQDKLTGIFEADVPNSLSDAETDVLLTSLYLFYAEKVVRGVDESTSKSLEWLLPRKELSYQNMLDSIMLNPKLLDRDEKVVFRQYYKLRDVLQKYREIEKAGGWKMIEADPKLKAYKPGDTSKTILQVRAHLFITGDIAANNGSTRYDPELEAAIKKYQLRNGKNIQQAITPALIREMNIPVSERIKKIIVNMERCRWITPEVLQAPELIFVNIPSFKLNVYREGISDFECRVVVGKTMSKTVIFSGSMSSIVFSPYWVLPTSIINSEVKPGMAKNKNYLEAHNMEWNNGQVRQKPGKNNSLGLVKFLFPNSNNIYLHDTPAKNLFERESRAFSHGCIRVGKPRDLAVNLLGADPAWTPQKIDAAMHAGTETWYTLKKKIPVYIGYFTAFVDAQGAVNFFEDVYKRDERLYNILVEK